MKEKSDGFEGLVADLVGNVAMEEAVGLLERGMIHRALEISEGNQSKASRLLHIHRNTLQRKMVEYSIGGTRPRARRKPASRESRPASRRRRNGAA
jgi:DNA-binding NtrC family response regulator